MGEDLSKIDTSSVDTNTLSIAQNILNEDDVNKVKDLTHLFNLNQSKKNVIRVMKLNELMDNVSDRIIERFEKYPDNFSNADLLNYLQVTQNAIDKANKNLNLVDETPVINIQQNNQVNVNVVDTLDSESKARVLSAIQSILSQNNQDDDDVVEIIQEDSIEDE